MDDFGHQQVGMRSEEYLSTHQALRLELWSWHGGLEEMDLRAIHDTRSQARARPVEIIKVLR